MLAGKYYEQKQKHKLPTSISYLILVFIYWKLAGKVLVTDSRYGLLVFFSIVFKNRKSVFFFIERFQKTFSNTKVKAQLFDINHIILFLSLDSQFRLEDNFFLKIYQDLKKISKIFDFHGLWLDLVWIFLGEYASGYQSHFHCRL